MCRWLRSESRKGGRKRRELSHASGILASICGVVTAMTRELQHRSDPALQGLVVPQ
jgi:hypothetical protein